MKVIDEIYQVLMDRKANPQEGSYVTSLMAGGLDSIAAKVEEESGEVIEAARSGSRSEIIHEAADLLFHLLVLLGYKDITPAEVEAELLRRRK